MQYYRNYKLPVVERTTLRSVSLYWCAVVKQEGNAAGVAVSKGISPEFVFSLVNKSALYPPQLLLP